MKMKEIRSRRQIDQLTYTTTCNKRFSIPYEPQLKGSLFKTINDLI
jgi:hypothetical protein